MLLSRLLRRSYSRLALDPLQEESLKEMCILVDQNDTPIGEASKRECHRVGNKSLGEEGLLLHRAFSVLLWNREGELLVQRRSEHKITYPGHVTNTCCSHPLHQIPAERLEDPPALGVRLAAIRRLNYELGIPFNQMSVDDLVYVTRILYRCEGDGEWGEHEVDYILCMRKEVDLEANPSEVSHLAWLRREELLSSTQGLASTGAFPPSPLTPWFSLLLSSRLLHTWWDNLHRLKEIADHRTIHTFK